MASVPLKTKIFNPRVHENFLDSYQAIRDTDSIWHGYKDVHR